MPLQKTGCTYAVLGFEERGDMIQWKVGSWPVGSGPRREGTILCLIHMLFCKLE